MNSHSNGAVFLPYHLRIGIDIRFLKDAKVVIHAEKPCRYEDIRQMVGRGQRALGVYSGFYYENKHAAQTEAVRERVTKPTAFNFKEGGAVIKMVNSSLMELSVQDERQNFVKAVKNQTWIVTKEDFKKRCGLTTLKSPKID